MVQLAFCSNTGKEYALKIFACPDSYAADKTFYQQVAPTLACDGPTGTEHPFARGYAFIDSAADDAWGLPTPPYIVMERADCLAATSSDEHCLDRLTAFNVRIPSLCPPVTDPYSAAV